MVKLELIGLSLQLKEENTLCIHWDEQQLMADENDEIPSRNSSPSSFSSSPLSVGTLCFRRDSAGDTDGQPETKDGSRQYNHYSIYLRSSNPLAQSCIPCRCRAFAAPLPKRRHQTNGYYTRAIVTETTMVRVLPAKCFHTRLTGEVEESLVQNDMEETLHNHNPQTIQQLTRRLQSILDRPIQIGTTEDALQLQRRSQRRRTMIKSAMIQYINGQSEQESPIRSNPATQEEPVYNDSIFRDASLIVHSPHHGAGKTRLVAALARLKLGCQRVHIIRPGPLLAKFGIHADTALETMVHEIVLSAALRQESICIILDHLDAMLPPSMLSNQSSAGDAAGPVLTGIAAYVWNLSKSLNDRQELPFPKRTPLYNLRGKHGNVLSVHMCLVGIVTCPDDGYKKDHGSDHSSGRTVLESMVCGRYRLPDLTAETRLSALQYAMRQKNLALDKELEERLPFLAASAVWARGGIFEMVATKLDELRSREDHRSVTTLADFVSVISAFPKAHAAFLKTTTIEFTARSSNNAFAYIGGNDEAKMTLAESLMLDPVKHKLFLRLELKPPTGVLLYGPPGTGKTLMAKAVANMLRSQSTTFRPALVGGAFVSISSTDIVCAEVGSGEKILTTSFETAKANAPAVVFIDEFQALFVERSRAGSGRLSATLLSCMDDLVKRRDLNVEQEETIVGVDTSDDRVLVLAATNTPWMIDKAFLRPGRFDRTVYVALPSLKERQAILRLTIGKMKHEFTDEEALGNLCNVLASLTDGFSGADLVSLCRAAAMEALKDGVTLVRAGDFHKAVQTTGASTSASTLGRLERWLPWRLLGPTKTLVALTDCDSRVEKAALDSRAAEQALFRLVESIGMSVQHRCGAGEEKEINYR